MSDIDTMDRQVADRRQRQLQAWSVTGGPTIRREDALDIAPNHESAEAYKRVLADQRLIPEVIRHWDLDRYIVPECGRDSHLDVAPGAARRRTATPGSHRAGGDVSHRDGGPRSLRRASENLHRPVALHRGRSPAAGPKCVQHCWLLWVRMPASASSAPGTRR